MITVDLHSPQRPAAVLAALRAYGGEWRESRIPAEVRDAGVMAVDCSMKGSTCTLTYACRSNHGPYLRARATVVAEGEGSRIRVELANNLGDITLPAMGAGVVTVIGLFALGPIALLYPLALMLLLAAMHMFWRVVDGELSLRSPNVAYLLLRVEDAVGQAA